MDQAFQSATALAGAIKNREMGSEELLTLMLDRVARFNPDLNAVICMDEQGARRRARAADAALARGEDWGPLHGVPMTVKEAFDLVGMPTTWGYERHANNLPERNAVTVDRLLDAGAIIYGKTNVPVALADWQSFNPIYGTTSNPWDLRRTPGGSSGGSAAALAAGLSALELGSDIGASIRNPAHYCGVYGHKPTFGVVTMAGQALPDHQAAAEEDICVAGPMARSATDLALALDIIAGPDPIDARGWSVKLPGPTKNSLRDFRVGVMLDDPQAEVDESVRSALREVAAFLADAGAHVSFEARPELDSGEVHRTYIQLLRAATSGFVPDVDYAEHQRLAAKLAASGETSDIHPYVAQMVRATTMGHRQWIALNETRYRMRLTWDAFFKDYDLLLCPAATTAAFEKNEQGERWERMVSVNGKPQPTTTPLFWAGYSCLCYLPSTVAPAGLTTEGLPVGVQIIGPQYGDHTCIHFAKLLEQDFRAFQPPPAYA